MYLVRYLLSCRVRRCIQSVDGGSAAPKAKRCPMVGQQHDQCICRAVKMKTMKSGGRSVSSAKAAAAGTWVDVRSAWLPSEYGRSSNRPPSRDHSIVSTSTSSTVQIPTVVMAGGLLLALPSRRKRHVVTLSAPLYRLDGTCGSVSSFLLDLLHRLRMPTTIPIDKFEYYEQQCSKYSFVHLLAITLPIHDGSVGTFFHRNVPPVLDNNSTRVVLNN